MADNDQSIYNLRFNQVSNEIEGFGGGTPQWTTLTITNVDPSQVPASRLINTTAPLTGGGNLSADRTIAIPKATSSVDGYLFHTDWSTFNNKQSAGSYITALTGDVTAAGPGSAVATIANTAVTPGSYTSANITVGADGRITAAANGSGGSIPGGSDKQFQYNNAGAFGGSTIFTLDVTADAPTPHPVISDATNAPFLSIVGGPHSANLELNGDTPGGGNVYFQSSDTSAFYAQLNGNASGFLTITTHGAGLFLSDNGTDSKLSLNGTGTASDPSAVLDLGSSANNLGFLPPRLTTAQRTAISSPAEGLIVYDTDLHQLWEYQNGAWAEVGGGGGGGSPNVIFTFSTNDDTTTSATPVTSSLVVGLTPSSSSAKILIMATFSSFSADTSAQGQYFLFRDGVNVIDRPLALGLQTGDATLGSNRTPQAITYVDAPGDTSLHTYAIYFSSSDGATAVYVANNASAGTLTALEIH